MISVIAFIQWACERLRMGAKGCERNWEERKGGGGKVKRRKRAAANCAASVPTPLEDNVIRMSVATTWN